VHCATRCTQPQTFRLDGLPITGREGAEVEVSAVARALTSAAIICFGVPSVCFVSLYFGSMTVMSHWQALLVALCGSVLALKWAGNRGAMIEQQLAVCARYVKPEDVS
jgi:hypothetical protein